MQKIVNGRLLAATALISLLAACSTTGGPGTEGNWSRLGETGNGNIRAYIDKDSIVRNGDVVTFRDRKVVVKPSEERYANTPPYKTAIGTWEMNCRAKTYRLTQLLLVDKEGKPLTDQKYTASQLRPMQVMAGSITEKQYQAACSGN